MAKLLTASTLDNVRKFFIGGLWLRMYAHARDDRSMRARAQHAFRVTSRRSRVRHAARFLASRAFV